MENVLWLVWTQGLLIRSLILRSYRIISFYNFEVLQTVYKEAPMRIKIKVGGWMTTSVHLEFFLKQYNFFSGRINHSLSWLQLLASNIIWKNKIDVDNKPIELYYPRKFELCVCVQLWEIIHVPCTKSSISTLQCCTLCYSILSHATLILCYYASILSQQNSVNSHALWLRQVWYYGE
jgi:hypothetical protein